MSSSTDIIQTISGDAEAAVEQIIEDSGRLHTIVNGGGEESAKTEDGSLIPSVRKAIIDNLYFKTPVLSWREGSAVTEFNQLYSFQSSDGLTSWWYAPGASNTNQVFMQASPENDKNFRLFMDKTGADGKYAPIDSPSFTGNPRVPLAADGDNSESVASTQWVQSTLGPIKGSLEGYEKGNFENITVKNDSVLADVYINGEFIVTSDKISAPSSEATLSKIHLVGDNAELSFDQNSLPPEGTSTKTNLLPYEVSTGKLVTDKATISSAEVGNTSSSGAALDVSGYMVGDYLHLQGNSNNSVTKPQLVVDGIAEISTLRVTEKLEGVKGDVDGVDINPNSVTSNMGITSGGDTTVGKNLTVSGKTTVQDLDVKGALSGVTLSVDGKDISPNKVTSNSDLGVGGNLSVNGISGFTGKVVTQDLEVQGKLTADFDLSGSQVKMGSLTVENTAVITDLVVTGNTVGVKGDVDGVDINPNSVESAGYIKGESLEVSGSAKVDGNLEVAGDLISSGAFSPATIATDSISSSTSDVSGTATVKDLVVTGTTTGVYADVDGADIKPKSGAFSGDVSIASALDVAGKTTLGDVEFTGTVEGLDVSLPDSDLSVVNLTVSEETKTSKLSSGSISNSGAIVTQDLQVLGSLTDKDGNNIVSGGGSDTGVDGKDIVPNSVSTGILKSSSLEVTGNTSVKINSGLTVSSGDILAQESNAVFKDVTVKGSLMGPDGSVIGSLESLTGKTINPGSVVSSGEIKAPSLEVEGGVSSQSTTTSTLSVSGLSTLSSANLSGTLTGGIAQFNNLKIAREAGTEDKRFVVEGDSEIEGDLIVTGTITGKVDLTSQDVYTNSLTSADFIKAKSITTSAAVTGHTGVFGGGTAEGQFGLQSLSDAKVDGGLEVTGDLSVAGTIAGMIDLSGKDVSPRSVSASSNIETPALTVSEEIVTKNLKVTGQTEFSEGAVFDTEEIKSNIFTVKPSADLELGSGSWTPDGKFSVYNVTITSDTVINTPAVLSGAGSYYYYIDQDSVGGHSVSFGSSYLQLGEGDLNTAPNSTTLVQVIYRGKGTILDYVILPRG